MQEEDPLGPFNYNYVKAVQYFEMVALEGQELSFHHFKLQVNGSEDNERVVQSLSEIEPGMNTLISIKFHIIRVIRFEHCTYMLATTYKPYNKHTLTILVSVNSKTKKQSTILQQCFMPKVQIKISNVFSRQGQNQFLPQLIFLSDYVKITQTSPTQTTNSTSDQLRQQANIYFKNKQFVEAIIKYQQSLAHILGPSPRNRSILYSNTSACFYELRLYNSCSIYAELAISIDPFYNKAYYRKIHSYLEMKKYNETLPLLSRIYTLINRADFQKLNSKYTHYIASETGIVNWSNIFKGREQLQGEYISSKITKIRTQNEIIYYAKQNISQYQLILIAKPLIYIKQTGNKFKQSFIIFLKQIENYYLYDDQFEQSILFLPCKCHPTYKSRKDFYKHHKNQAKIVHKKQLFNKMQRCIFQQKSLDKSESQNGYGIWKQMFYFQNKCTPNCTGVHINSSYVVNAVTSIQKGTPLSIDLIADVDSSKRRQTLNIKFDTKCQCKICQFKQSSNIQFNKIEQLYDRFQKYQLCKKKKQHIWAIINYQWQDRQVLEEQFAQLIYYYIYVIQKQCQWDDILNLLRLKEQNDNIEINNHIDQSLKRLISKLLSIHEKDIDGFYDHVIEKYIRYSRNQEQM